MARLVDVDHRAQLLTQVVRDAAQSDSGIDRARDRRARTDERGHDREIHDRIFTIGQPGNYGATLSWYPDDTPDEEQTDGIGAREGVRLLERSARNKQPFFLAVGFYRPHTPYVAPKKYFDLYPPDRITLPALSQAAGRLKLNV